jgi:hypothetical protein
MTKKITLSKGKKITSYLRKRAERKIPFSSEITTKEGILKNTPKSAAKHIVSANRYASKHSPTNSKKKNALLLAKSARSEAKAGMALPHRSYGMDVVKKANRKVKLLRKINK